MEMIISMFDSENTYRADADCIQNFLSPDYFNLFVRYDGDLVSELANTDYACAINISINAYIVSVRNGSLQRFYSEFNNALNIEPSFPYTLSELQPAVAANITRFHNPNYLGLTGNNTIAVIIDTGIDYLNPQFINDDNTSRIRLIWDQTIQSDTPYNNIAFYGSVYTNDDINRAISAQNSGGNPYDIVPSRDENGHGTNMAGLVGAKGLNNVLGGAPQCEFIIIKLKQMKKLNLEILGILDDKNIPIFEGLDIFNAINFSANYQSEINVPMAVLISCGTNWTSHQGMSSLETYINFFSTRRGFIIVTNTGNQGASQTHASGVIRSAGDVSNIEINIGPNEKNFSCIIWILKPNRMTASLVSPTGEVVTPVQPIGRLGESETIDLVLENSSVTFSLNPYDVASGNETIYVSIKNPKSGIWQLRLKGTYIVDGTFNIWLPQRPIINEETRFIKSDPYITLLSPSIAEKAVTTAFYDQSNNTINSDSGRGYSVGGKIKPDLATGGVDALTTGLNGENVSVTGGSVAGAVLCSAVLLLLEWGIIKNNDPLIYSTSVISYLTRGTDKRPGDIYPNPQWGYGMLNLQSSFENLRCCPPDDNNDKTVDKLFIRIPPELYYRLNREV